MPKKNLESSLRFSVFESAAYARVNPDAVRAVKWGRHKTLYDHWQAVGRAQFLQGKRFPGIAQHGVGYDEARYFAGCGDVKAAVATKKFPSGFSHWIRNGLMETVSGQRDDVLGILHRESRSVFSTTGAGGSDWASFLAVPDIAGRKDISLNVRDVSGAWIKTELRYTERVPGNTSAVDSRPMNGWVIIVFTSSSEPAQVFVGLRDAQDDWTESMVVRAVGTSQSGAAFRDLTAVQLFEGLIKDKVFSRNPKVLLQLLSQVGLVSQSSHQKMYVDRLELLNSMYLQGMGWFLDGLEPWDRIMILSGGAIVTINRDQCLSHPRPDLKTIPGVTEEDVFDAGFLFLCQVDKNIGHDGKPFVVGLGKSRLSWVEVAIDLVDETCDGIVRRCINYISGVTKGGQLPAFLCAGAGPVLADMIKRRNESIEKVFETRNFGATKEECPRVSVIIPLYGRVDFILFQLAQFSQDIAFQDIEVVYVLDDPKKRSSCLDIAELSHVLFRLPFRLLLMRNNQGFGGANNAGAAIARGEILVFLNSDIIPTSTGWVPKLVQPLNSDGTGVVGARLLYHDGTIQHDGMAYRYSERQSANGGMIECIHPGKGMIPALSEKGEYEVTVVTGACLAIRNRDFKQVGGFSSDFFIGDYEDSDLCLRIRRLGKGIVLSKDCVLYHLERQSVPRTQESATTSTINAYIHETKWSHELAKLSVVKERGQ